MNDGTLSSIASANACHDFEDPTIARISVPGFVRVLLLFVGVLIPLRASAQCCRVQGVVRSEAGTPLADATVLLSAPELPKPQSTTTSADGHYQFESVKLGIWAEVRVLVHGRAVAESITLVTTAVETLDVRVSAASTSAASAEDLRPMGGESGELRGTVRAPDGTPVAGALVAIENTEIQAITDSAGRYSFGRVRAPLTLDLNVSADGFESRTEHAAVNPGGSGGSNVELSPVAHDDDGALDVGRQPRDRESLMLRGPELAVLPSLAPTDVFRARQLLPDATVRDDSELVLGATPPGSTRVTIDDIPWFRSSRLFGAIGAPLNTAFVQQATTSDISLNSPVGGELNGGFDLSGRPSPQGRPGGSADVSFFGVAGLAEVPLPRSGSIAFGVRHSLPSSTYSDVLNQFGGNDQHWVRDRIPALAGATSSGFGPPSFSDVNGRVEFAPGRGNRITASLYQGQDDGNFSRDIVGVAGTGAIGVPPVLPLPPDATVQIADAQTWKGSGGSVSWTSQWSPTVSTEAVVAQSRFTTARQVSRLLTSATTGLDYNLVAGLGDSNGSNETNEMRDTDVRADASIEAGFSHALQVGVERTALDSTYHAQVTATSGLANLLARTESGNVVTVFGQDSWTPMARLTVSPGARFSWYDVANTSYADPRVTVSYAALPRLVVKGAWAMDHQPAQRLTYEDRQHGDNDFWTLSDGTVVPVARSNEVSGEATVDMPGLLFDARLYYRALDDLTLFAPRRLPGATPAPGDATFHVGTGTSVGFELLAQYRRDRNSLWASYAASRADYSFPTLEAAKFPASFDRRHQIKAADAVNLWKGLSVTAVMVAASGAPYTPASTAEPVWFPNGDVAYQPQFDAKNSARFPLYQRLDLSGQIERHLGPATAAAGLSVFNVYDAKNIAYYDYEVTGPTLTTTETYLMRRAFNAFVRVRF